jgi:hypothetical protein
MKVNVSHERVISAPPERIAALVADFAKVWPRKFGPPPRLQSPGVYDADLMVWQEYERPGATRAFRIIAPDVLRGGHWFSLEPIGGGRTLLRHSIEGEALGEGESLWLTKIEPLHGVVIEAILDNIEAAVAS